MKHLISFVLLSLISSAISKPSLYEPIVYTSPIDEYKILEPHVSTKVYSRPLHDIKYLEPYESVKIIKAPEHYYDDSLLHSYYEGHPISYSKYDDGICGPELVYCNPHKIGAIKYTTKYEYPSYGYGYGLTGYGLGYKKPYYSSYKYSSPKYIGYGLDEHSLPLGGHDLGLGYEYKEPYVSSYISSYPKLGYGSSKWDGYGGYGLGGYSLGYKSPYIPSYSEPKYYDSKLDIEDGYGGYSSIIKYKLPYISSYSKYISSDLSWGGLGYGLDGYGAKSYELYKKKK